jgi:hypothetical protein
MWIDKQLMFSEDQSLVSSASDVITSTNVVDVNEAKRGEGNIIEVFADLTTAITTAITTTATSTLRAQLITSDAATLDSNTTTLYDTGALAYTSWDAIGDGPHIRALPNNAKQYLAWVLTVGAGMDITAGNFSSNLVLGVPSNK